MGIFKRVGKIFLIFVLGSLLYGCGAQPEAITDTRSEEEKSEGDYWYEAVFLDKDTLDGIFSEVRGEVPYSCFNGEYHVTTAFKPEPKQEALYGKPVLVKLTVYKDGETQTDEGKTTHNEGFLAEVTSDDAEMQEFLDSLDVLWHVTGTYEDNAKYTAAIDFSDGLPVEKTVAGVFGCGYSDGTVDLGK